MYICAPYDPVNTVSYLGSLLAPTLGKPTARASDLLLLQEPAKPQRYVAERSHLALQDSFIDIEV